MILRFDEYNKFNGFIKSHTVEDDNFLNERLSISEDVISETMRVVKYIESEINKGNYKTIKPTAPNGGLDYDIIRLKNDTITLFDKKKIILNIKIHRFKGYNDDVNKFETDAKMISSVKKSIFAVLSTKVQFELYGNIVIYNGRVSEGSYPVIGHEIRHAYEYLHIYDGKPLFTLTQQIESKKKWKKIYNTVSDYLQNIDEETIDSKNENDFYQMIYAIYMSDISEISAFTQQTYEQCKKSKTISELKASLKQSKLYMMIDTYKDVFNIIETPEMQKQFNQKIVEYNLDLPSLNKLTQLFKKRFKKAQSNYGKVFAFIKEEIDSQEDGELIFTDIKY